LPRLIVNPGASDQMISDVVDWSNEATSINGSFRPHAMSDLSLECAAKRTSAGHSEFMG
jgi:hypothetical protein